MYTLRFHRHDVIIDGDEVTLLSMVVMSCGVDTIKLNILLHPRVYGFMTQRSPFCLYRIYLDISQTVLDREQRFNKDFTLVTNAN